ncbi:hypothetical protein [Streptomyces lavendulae]|uniref:hypothetical protein n=1 Tax=Streptomyces lavendulae TaxID=1914 RepID=UPI003818A67C
MLLSVLAAGVWGSGCRPGAPRPRPRGSGAGRGPAGARADEERSLRLLTAADRAFSTGRGVRALGEEGSFERIVLLGVGWVPGREYPPPGHGYPEE